MTSRAVWATAKKEARPKEVNATGPPGLPATVYSRKRVVGTALFLTTGFQRSGAVPAFDSLAGRDKGKDWLRFAYS